VIDLTIQEFRALKESPSRRRTRPLEESPEGLVMLSLESTSSRMSNLARQELYFGRFIRSTKFSPASEA